MQYIVAKATKSHSLTAPGDCKPDYELCLGVQKLNITWGVCPNTIAIFKDDSGQKRIDTSNIIANASRYIINDFEAGAYYASRPYVTSFPHTRSYAEVPLLSPLGYVIGSYCVVDRKLRAFRDEAITTLSSVAETITNHLVFKRDSRQRSRSHTLMKALSSILEHIFESMSVEPSPSSRTNSSDRHSGPPSGSLLRHC
jgi:hypothetical protein